MITLYLWDGQNILAGSQEVDEAGALPMRSTPSVPPELEGTEVARWTGEGWEKLDGRPLPPEPEPEPIESQIVRAYAERDRLMAWATVRIAPLQDAVDIDDATSADIALLKKWKQYRVALNRIQDQPAFPADVTWPVAPE